MGCADLWDSVKYMVGNVHPILISLLALFIFVWFVFGILFKQVMLGLVLALFIVVMAIVVFLRRWI